MCDGSDVQWDGPLQSSNDTERIAALKTITARDISPAVIVHLHAAVLSPSTAIRYAAIQCWHRCQCGVDDIVMRATSDRDDAVRAEAFFVVLGWQDLDWGEWCRRGLLDRSSTVRMTMLRAIGFYDLPVVADLLYDRLHDTDSQVATKAAELLAIRQDAVGVAWLTDSLERGITRKRLAIRALGHARVQAVVPLLMHEIKQRSACMLCSIDALGLIAATESLPLLLVLVADQSFAVRTAAIKALRNVNNPTVIVPVMQQAVARDARLHVRMAAMAVLQRYEVIPEYCEFPLYAAHVEKVPTAWLAALVAGSRDDVLARLQYLYAQDIESTCKGFTERVYAHILNRSDSATLLQQCVCSNDPYLMILGLMGYEIHRMAVCAEIVTTLLTHPDMTVRKHIFKILRKFAAHDDVLLHMAWQLNDVRMRKSLVKEMLNRDAQIRAMVLNSACSDIQQQIISLLMADIRADCQLVLRLCAHEIATLAQWQHDTRLHNRIHIADIIATWHCIPRQSSA